MQQVSESHTTLIANHKLSKYRRFDFEIGEFCCHNILKRQERKFDFQTPIGAVKSGIRSKEGARKERGRNGEGRGGG